MLLGICALYVIPVLLLQLSGVVLKTGRELRQLRQAGQQQRGWFLHVLSRHVSIVTPRGWALLLTGLAFLLASLAYRWASLGTLAMLAFLMFYGVVGLSAFVSAFLARGFSRGMMRRGGEISRGMSPALALAGEAAEERFTLTRVPVPPGYCLLIEDELPAKLQTHTRHAVGAGAAQTRVTVSGRLRRTPRGLHHLGPARIWYQDILGLTRISVASSAMAKLKVVPRFCELVIVRPPRSAMQSPDVVSRPHRFPTEDYFRFKEYTPGDDTRRINWKLSIRTGRLQIRVPETREVTTNTVILVLDSYIMPVQLPHAVGVEHVLDRLVETWLSLADVLVEQGEKVTLVAVADSGGGALRAERMPANNNPRPRWQDLGARVRWQSDVDLPQMLGEVGSAVHGVAVSARFAAPPPQPFPGQQLSWIYLPPDQALGPPDPAFWRYMVGQGRGAGTRLMSALVRLPFPAGSDDNAVTAQLRTVLREKRQYEARRALRGMAWSGGQQVLGALVARGDVVYRLEPGIRRHRIVGVSAGARV